MTSRLNHMLFITTMVSFMTLVYLDQNGVGVTLSHIQTTFKISSTALQWVMNSMLIAIAVSVLIAGKLGDMFGTRRIFSLGVIGFMLASALCSVAPNIYWMYAGRALQGLTASFMLTNYIVLIHHQYPKSEWPKIVGLCVSISAVFGAAAPAIAGVLTQWLSWRGFFMINVPICLLTFGLTLACMKKTAGHASKENIDYNGMILLILAIGGCVGAITESSQFGWDNNGVIVTLAASICLFVIFFLFEQRQKNPILHFEVLKDKLILSGNIILFCLQTSLICTVYFALWMQHVLGFTPFITGLAYLPQTIPVIIMATYAGHWASRKGYRSPIVFGLTLATLSIICLTAAFFKQDYYCILPFLFLWAAGASCALPTTVSAILSNVDTALKGMVIGINQTCRSLASAIGLAVFGTILVSSYGNKPVINTMTSKTAYTHAFIHAMLLPACLTIIAMIVGWIFIKPDSIENQS